MMPLQTDLLASVLINNSHLKVLNLECIDSITNEGWQAIFDALQNPRCMLEEFKVDGNGFGDEDVTHLANLLSSNSVH